MACERHEITEQLRRHGLRPTPARCRILELLTRRREHYSPEEMLEALREEGEPMSIATLYQNLAKLSEAGVIGRFVGPDGVSRYDVVTEPHHHLVCEVCGRIVDVEAEGLKALKPRPLHGNSLDGWQVREKRVEFVGVCPACQEKRARA